jgi:penicillin-binding protein 1A
MLTSGLMERVMNEGTGAAARSEYHFKEKAGGKTGTTNDYKDAWFVGFTSEVTCGVWVGLDQPATIMSGAYGAKLALPVWADVMNESVSLNYKSAVPKAEPMMAKAILCRVSGLLATDGCRAEGQAYEDELPADLVPQAYCSVHGAGGPATSTERKEGFFGRLFKWFR